MGKGSSRRPAGISEGEWAARWALAFGVHGLQANDRTRATPLDCDSPEPLCLPLEQVIQGIGRPKYGGFLGLPRPDGDLALDNATECDTHGQTPSQG